MEHTLVRLKAILSGSLHLGGILLIFTVILGLAISSRDLVIFPLATVAFCHPNSLHPALGLLYGARCTQLQHPQLVTAEAPLSEEGKRSE